MMDIKQFNSLIDNYIECKNYLEGRVHSPKIAEMAKAAATKEIKNYRDSIIHKLVEAGLCIKGD